MSEITKPGLKLVVLASSLLMTSYILFASLFAVTSTNFNGEPNTMLSRIIASGVAVLAVGQLITVLVSFGSGRQKLFRFASIVLTVEVAGLLLLIALN